MEDNDLAAAFLESYELSGPKFHNDYERYVLTDTGFMARIGRKLEARINKLHGIRIWRNGTLVLRLISAGKAAYGKRILEFDGTEQIITPQRAYQAIHHPFHHPYDNTYGLAIGMQLMPRYHGAYTALAEYNNEVVAISDLDPLQSVDVDEQDLGINTSVVNSVAAAITQYRVVKAAMQRPVGDGDNGV